MAFDNGYTAVTAGTLSAAQWNTYVRDNFTALFPFTTAGDIVYATAANTLSRLAPATSDALLMYDLTATAPVWLASSTDNAYKLLRQNSTGNGFEWVGGGITAGTNESTGGYTYNSSTYRDVPSSSLNVTVSVPSTIIVIGSYVGLNPTEGRGYQVYADIDGTDGGLVESTSKTKETVTPIAYKASVSAGTKTVKLRERHEFDDTYNIVRWSFVVFVIPE